MNLKKKILLVIAGAFIVIQFFPPAKNISTEPSGTEIGTQFIIPSEVQSILRTSCYDCHSNNTRYPWYSYIQPVGWWLANHIKEAKEELNFDVFASYSQKKQHRKLGKIKKEVTEKEMPLSSYLVIHRDAVLSEQQIQLFADWTQTARSQIESIAPPENFKDDEDGDDEENVND